MYCNKSQMTQRTMVLCTNTIIWYLLLLDLGLYWRPDVYLKPVLYWNKCSHTPGLYLRPSFY